MDAHTPDAPLNGEEVPEHPSLADVLDQEGYGYWIDTDQLVDTLREHSTLVVGTILSNASLVLAEQEFLAASVAVWREIDIQSSEPEGYQGLDQSTALRKRERAAWERYRDLLDAPHIGSKGPRD